MPVQIRELVIRAVVAPPPQGGGTQREPAQQQEELVRECVEQVLEILKNQNER